MTTTTTVISFKRPNTYPAILLGGLSCGILDITAAIVTARLRAGTSPMRVLQSVAAGLLGANAYKGGLETALLGLGIHFLIAFSAATVFYLASRKLKFITKYPLVSGPLYGLAVFAFMRLVVFPLAGLPKIITATVSSVLIAIVIHMLFVGLPISLATSRFSK
jgi:hypothetical protein